MEANKRFLKWREKLKKIVSQEYSPTGAEDSAINTVALIKTLEELECTPLKQN